jgi:hypothetical protein
MKRHALLSGTLVIALISPKLFAQDQPQMPFIDQGACPFECCVYGKWKANEDVVAFIEPKDSAPIAFKIQKGEDVVAETGFVLTIEPGVSKILKPVRLGYDYSSNGSEQMLELKPGETLYTLHYLGEGLDLFWYKGKLYSDGVAGREPDPTTPPPDLKIQTLSLSKYVWWIKIKTKTGKAGWIKDPPYFEGADACS